MTVLQISLEDEDTQNSWPMGNLPWKFRKASIDVTSDVKWVPFTASRVSPNIAHEVTASKPLRGSSRMELLC